MNRLKELRNAEKLTLRELSKKIDIPPQSLSYYELGKIEPNLSNLVKLADFYRVSLDYLLERTIQTDTALYEQYTEQEKEIVSNYRKCTKVQQAQTLGYAEAFAQINEQRNNSNKR